MRALWLAALLALLAPAVNAAADVAITVTNAWSRATPPAATVGVVYADLIAAQADELIAIDAGSVAERAEVHVSSNEGGTMKMRPSSSVMLPARERIRFQPGGVHVMLIGLRMPLVAGATISLTFRFRNAAPLRAEARIIAPGEREPGLSTTH